MAITVKKIALWNVVVDNEPGALSRVLEPLAEAGADLSIMMATSIPGAKGKASVGVFPVSGRRVIAAARAVGLAPAAAMPSLLVGGENKAGLGRRMAEAIAAAGINIGVAVAQVVGPNFSALFGFETEEDAAEAAALLKKLGRTSAPRGTAAKASKGSAKKPANGVRRSGVDVPGKKAPKGGAAKSAKGMAAPAAAGRGPAKGRRR